MKYKGNLEKYQQIISHIPPAFILSDEDLSTKLTSLAEIMRNIASAVGFAVIEDGKIDCVGVEGVLRPNDSSSPPATVESLFNTSSIAKAVTSYATIHCLNEQGISLDDSIDKYFPPVLTDYPFDKEEIDVDNFTDFEITEHNVESVAKQEPVSALALIAQLKAWAEKQKQQIDMTTVNALEQTVLRTHAFLYGTLEVRRVLQKFTGKGITFRELLEHSSGIKDGVFPKGDADYTTSTEFSMEELGQASVERSSTDEKRMWKYSNAGYVVVECALESLMGKPFTAIMKQYVFDPLSMNNSTFSQTTETFEDPNRQFVHGQKNDGTTLPHLMLSRGSGGMHTTPEDYAKFANELIRVYNSPEADATKEMFTKQDRKMENGSQCNYGLGIGVSDSGDTLLFEHTGGCINSCTHVQIYPLRRQAAVVMVNTKRSVRFTKQILSAIANAYQWANPTALEPTVLFPIPEDQFSKYVGEYQMPDVMGNIKVQILQKDGSLKLQLPWPQPDSEPLQMTIFQDKDGTLFTPNLNTEIDLNIKIAYNEVNKTIELLFIDKIPPPSPLLAKLVEPTVQKNEEVKVVESPGFKI